jgi:hypothetical protein
VNFDHKSAERQGPHSSPQYAADNVVYLHEQRSARVSSETKSRSDRKDLEQHQQGPRLSKSHRVNLAKGCSGNHGRPMDLDDP